MINQHSHKIQSRFASKVAVLLSCVTLTTFTATTVAIAQTAEPKATASILNVKGELVGTATFAQTPLGVTVSLKVQNLAKGEHMVHVHEYGKCDAPDFKTSGNHFDPEDKDDEHDHEHMHNKHEEGKHKPTGDLPNIIVKQDGTGSLNAILPELTLGSGNNSLLKQGGTSIMIHAGADGKSTMPKVDYKTRIACGVIKP
ncbi:MAG: superoxide dismutase [Pseudanabaena sp.]|nr:MAG: superoxide dismutase [Pseudanabaena sp.]